MPNSSCLELPSQMGMKERKIRLLQFEAESKIRKARISFWDYCQLRAPDFYLDDRHYLWILCTTLQDLYEGKLLRNRHPDIPYKKLIINMPPRFGKTRTLILFCEWVLGVNPTNRIIACSYNDDAASDFSRFTRDGIAEEKNLPHQIVFSDIFPFSRIKEGYASFHKWALEGQFFSYLGAGIGGSITGKGGNILINDDPVKNAQIAMNQIALESIFKWYTGTFLSRKEKDAIEILNMTRWAIDDLTGKVKDLSNSFLWYEIIFEAMDEETGEMLCEDILSREEYEEKKVSMDPMIFRANYHQIAINEEGRLYKELKEYDRLPKDENKNILFDRIINYTDTADEGSDYLCSISALEYQGDAYILDAYYTKEGMEITEKETAFRLAYNNVGLAKIESNNGGRGFARALQRIQHEEYKRETLMLEKEVKKKTREGGSWIEQGVIEQPTIERIDGCRKWKRVPITWFHQSMNKRARILSESNYVMQHVFFPKNWHIKFPEFHKALTFYQREGTNKHDDAPDALTGLVEMIARGRPKARIISA